MFVVHGCRTDCAARVCSVVAKQVDKRELYLALAWDTARCDQHQRFIPGGGVRSCLENHAGHFDDIEWKLSMTNWIFGHELEQSRRAEVISTFKKNVLMNQFRMQFQQRS